MTSSFEAREEAYRVAAEDGAEDAVIAAFLAYVYDYYIHDPAAVWPTFRDNVAAVTKGRVRFMRDMLEQVNAESPVEGYPDNIDWDDLWNTRFDHVYWEFFTPYEGKQCVFVRGF